jgi:hypothetical protein
MKVNMSKFSWAELFSNNSGKTSGSGFVGVIVSLVGTLCFLMGCLDKMFFTNSIDIITQSIILVGIGTTLLGVRKIISGEKPNETKAEEPKDDQMIQS